MGGDWSAVLAKIIPAPDSSGPGRARIVATAVGKEHVIGRAARAVDEELEVRGEGRGEQARAGEADAAGRRRVERVGHGRRDTRVIAREDALVDARVPTVTNAQCVEARVARKRASKARRRRRRVAAVVADEAGGDEFHAPLARIGPAEGSKLCVHRAPALPDAGRLEYGARARRVAVRRCGECALARLDDGQAVGGEGHRGEGAADARERQEGRARARVRRPALLDDPAGARRRLRGRVEAEGDARGVGEASARARGRVGHGKGRREVAARRDRRRQGRQEAVNERRGGGRGGAGEQQVQRQQQKQKQQRRRRR